MDKGLRGRTATTAFAHADYPRCRAMFKHLRIDQIIDHYHLSLSQGFHRFQCQQFRISRTRTDQPDFSIHCAISS